MQPFRDRLCRPYVDGFKKAWSLSQYPLSLPIMLSAYVDDGSTKTTTGPLLRNMLWNDHAFAVKHVMYIVVAG